MTDFLDAVANVRLYADAVGLILLPLAGGVVLWLWLRAELRETRALKDQLRRLKS